MEQTPKYKVRQDVWFVTHDDKFEHGIVNGITPVNYNFLYTIKTKDESTGLSTKLSIWEDAILCDASDDVEKVLKEKDRR